MKAFNQRHLSVKNEDPKLFQRDVWKTDEFGLKPDTVHGIYQLNFSRLKPDWLKKAVKRFILYQAATKTLSSCYSYIGRLANFSDFISENYANILPHQIDRSVIIKYLTFLSKNNFSIVTRIMALVHLRTFHNIMVQENWLPWPKEPLIYSSDLPKNIEKIPKYIPEYVISQLQQKLHHLPVYMQHFVTILLETGRRVSEICTLPLNCLEQDDQGDYFLKINDKKMKKSYLIPISDDCLKAIKSQQILIHDNNFQNKIYLFSAKNKTKNPTCFRPICELFTN